MKKVIIGLIAIVVVVYGFILVKSNTISDKDNVAPYNPNNPTEEVVEEGDMKDESNIVLSDLNLDALSMGHYEGWLISGDKKVSTGKFNIGDSLNFSTDVDLSSVDKFAITVETEGDTDIIPSGIIVLVGDVVNGQSSSDLNFPIDLSISEGTYILGTPTDGNREDETSGVWFVSLPTVTKSLNLPDLPSGWIYEGWAVNQSMPLTTGRFADASADDLFNGFSGDKDPGPGFPGEDFIVNAPEGIEFPIDLADGESLIVISVEPELMGTDPTGPSPFSIKPLVAMIPANAGDHVNYDLGLNKDSLPTGVVTFK